MIKKYILEVDMDNVYTKRSNHTNEAEKLYVVSLPSGCELFLDDMDLASMRDDDKDLIDLMVDTDKFFKSGYACGWNAAVEKIKNTIEEVDNKHG